MKKKFTFLSAAFMLLVFLAVPLGMRGQSTTLVSGSGTNGYAVPDGWTTSGTVEGGSYLKFDDGTMTSPEFAPHYGLSFTYSVATFGSGTNHPLTIRILNASTDAVISEMTTDTPTSSTYINTGSPLSLGDVSVAFKIQMYGPTGKGVRLRNYSVTGTPAGSGSQTHTLTFVADPAAGGTVSVNNNTTGSITLEEGEDYNIIATPAEVGYAFNNWTVSGTGSSVGNASNASTTFTMGTEDATLTANFSTVTTYTVTYHANVTGIADIVVAYNAGTNVTVASNTFSNPGYAFTKWHTNAAGTGGSDYEPGDVINDIQANIDLYAQWEQSSQTTATLNIQNYANDHSWVNGTQYLTATVSDVTFTAAGGGNTGKYYTSGQEWRYYQGENATITISVPNGYHLVSIKPTYNSNNGGALLNGSATITSGSTVDVSGTSVTFSVGNSGSATNGQVRFTNIDVTYASEGGTLSPSDLTITNASTDLTFDLYNNATAQVINYTTSSTGAITITPASPTTYFSYVHDATNKTITVTPLAMTPSAQTVTISQEADATYYAGTATFTVSVTNSDPNVPGSLDNPYTVAQARAAIDANSGTQGVYATGIVSAIPTAYNSTYSNITFNMVDNTGDEEFLQAYRCGGTLASEVAVGDVVVVSGDLTKYGSTYEFGQGCEVVSVVHPAVTVEAPTFSPAAGTYADAQEVTISCATTGATIYYTTDGTEPTTSSATYSGAIPISTTTTIKAVAYVGTDHSTVVTATYHINSQANPYTVTQALAFYEYPANGIYVNGIVSTAPTQAPTSNGELTYYISVDGSTTDQLQVYKGKGLEQAAFTAQDDIQVGDIVTIYGNVKIYNSIKEFDAGNYLVYFERPTAPVVPILNAENVSIAYDATEGVINYTLENPASDGVLTAEITAGNEGGWLTLGTIGANIPFTCTANTATIARTATITLTYTYNTTETKTATAVVTQAAYVAPPTPGNWVLTNLADLTATDIFVIVSDNGDTYAMSNNNGTNKAPAAVAVTVTSGTLSGTIPDSLQWNISGNATDGYTFYPNGETEKWLYCTATNNGVRVGTNGNNAFTVDHDYLFNTATGRHIGVYNSQDWRCYLPQSSGDVHSNIAGQTFAFYKKVTSTEPTITVSPSSIAAESTGTSGTLGITLANMTITDVENQMSADFFNANGEPISGGKPNWIEFEFHLNGGTYSATYTIANNTTTSERNAYFKIYGLDDNGSTEAYSNLVSVTQAAYVAPVPAITIEPATVSAPAAETPGNMAITISNMTISDAGQLSADFCTATGGDIDPKPDWITDFDFQLNSGVFTGTYLIRENTAAEPRTAYFHVYGLDDNGTTEAYSNVIAVTQSAFVLDYAVLPFEWAGGSSTDLKALSGVTTSTLSNDYASNNAPYLIKFDNDGKYIQVKTDSQPAKVTIGVKMIGGGNTSYITVKASADGETFDDGEALEISGAQGDILTLNTTRTFNADVRYVKMVFTKGSNVGVGPITITKYSTDPVINADDVNLTYDAISGEIPYTITNPVAGKSLGAQTTASWISNIVVTDEKVSFTTTANDGTEDRVATFTLTYDGATDKIVTVTQAHFVADYAPLPFAFDGGRSDIENVMGLTQEGLDSDYSASPKLKFKNAGTWVILKLDEAPTSLSYDIKGNSFSGGTFDVLTSADGVTYESLATYTELGATQSITHINLASTVRYIKWVYTTKSSGNVALGNIHASTNYDIYGTVTVTSLDIPATKTCTIYDGGQLIHDSGTIPVTMVKHIKGYTGEKDHYYLITVPFNDVVDPTTVTGMVTGNFDLYEFHSREVGSEWANYEAQNSFTTLQPGVGYLYAKDSDIDLEFTGTINPSTDLEYLMGFNNDPAAPFDGWEIVGNPFACNTYIKDASATGEGMAFYRMNADGNGFTPATGAIKPLEAVFVQATADNQSFTFTRTAPVTSFGHGNLNLNLAQVVTNRGEQPATDNAIIRFDGGNTLEKFCFRDNNTKLYIPQNGKDYAVVRSEAQGEMPVNFKAANNGTYTLSFNAENIEFSYLHLIDNLTGNDVDLLATPSYTFDARYTDYASRFKLVFNANNGNLDGNDTFAFISDGDIIISGVNGNTTVQLFDVTGRMISSTNGTNHISTENMVSGVYMLRLINGNETKTQKIVVR